MKKKGNKCYYSDERDHQLRRAVARVMDRERGISAERVFELAAKERAPRFYVSEERAEDVIGRLVKAADPEDEYGKMTETRARMYRELKRRYDQERALHPDFSMRRIVFHIVNQGAPEFYLTGNSAREIYNRGRRRGVRSRE